MAKVDEYIPLPVRDVDKPFAMPIEAYFFDLRPRHEQLQWPRGTRDG